MSRANQFAVYLSGRRIRLNVCARVCVGCTRCAPGVQHTLVGLQWLFGSPQRFVAKIKFHGLQAEKVSEFDMKLVDIN